MKTHKIRLLFILVLLIFVPNLFSHESFQDTYTGMRKCLMKCYGVDETHTDVILSKIAPYMDKAEVQTAITNFITMSQLWNIQFKAGFVPAELAPNDAVYVAPQWHEVLFESPFVRILWASSKPGDHEPFHVHQWKRLLLILQGPEFEVDNFDGSIENGVWPVGVYELPPDIYPFSYKNLGPCDFIGLQCEVKD